MILAAHQPQYLPYPGLLGKIDAADVFVLQDDLQFVKQEWQNRNRIRTEQGWRWLTIPVCVGSSRDPILAVRASDRAWVSRHRRIVAAHYHGAPLQRLQPMWDAADGAADGSLARICQATLQALCSLCGIVTPIVLESELGLDASECGTKDDRLINLCRRLGCDRYISGSGATAYLNHDVWRMSGVQLELLHFAATPYRQWHEGWVPNLSCLDIVLCVDDVLGALRRDVQASILVPGGIVNGGHVVKTGHGSVAIVYRSANQPSETGGCVPVAAVKRHVKSQRGAHDARMISASKPCVAY